MIERWQIDKIREKEVDKTDAMKRDPDVNYYEGWFFVTLRTNGEVPVLSVCVGDVKKCYGEDGAARCLYTVVGKGVVDAWKRNEEVYKNVEVDMCEAMPEHFHGLIHLLPGNTKHLGQIIKGFMIGCSHAYWETLGIDRHSMGYTKGVRTPQYEDKDHTRSYRGPALFVHGYNETEPLTEEDVKVKRAYIRDQARKRLIQGDRHVCFEKHRHQHSRNWTVERVKGAISADRFFHFNGEKCRLAVERVMARLNVDVSGIDSMGIGGIGIGLDYIGDRQLLMADRKVPLICHRADAWQFDKQKEAVLQAARGGAVVVGAFISPKEREIRNELMVEMLPFIEITDNGLSETYKGVGKAFYALAENRLLQITPWRYEYQKNGVMVSREMCLVMNELARIISGVGEDWWKEV